tara:strand:- start:98 stop:466 length:369 start_codon:yes stop_codon:yes gene_type:complete
MSYLQNHSDVSVNENSETSAAPLDYTPQHPMYSVHGSKPAQSEDHLDEYQEVDPFEGTEFSVGGLIKSVKKAAKSLKKKAKKAVKDIKKAVAVEKAKPAEEESAEEESAKEESNEEEKEEEF